MPMTLSTLAGAGAYRTLFGLISSASTDGTALSLTITHGLSASIGLDATSATRLIDVLFLPVGDGSATGAFGWFLSSITGTTAIVGRSSVGAGASANPLTSCIFRFNHSLIQ